MARMLAPDSICLDIGAHAGSVLRQMVQAGAPGAALGGVTASPEPGGRS